MGWKAIAPCLERPGKLSSGPSDENHNLRDLVGPSHVSDVCLLVLSSPSICHQSITQAMQATASTGALDSVTVPGFRSLFVRNTQKGGLCTVEVSSVAESARVVRTWESDTNFHLFSANLWYFAVSC